jgi:hypothetical protein
MGYLDGDAVPCKEGELCRYSPQNAGEQGTRCVSCRLSPDNRVADTALPSYWRPLDKGVVHPILEQEKRAQAFKRHKDTRDERLNRDKVRQARLRLAAHAEKTTQKNIIRATKNSGRTDKDGDHVAGGYVTLDTKLQSKRLNPVVIATELAKVRNDSASAKTMVGGLVLRSKTGLGVVVFHEDDFAKILNLIEGK